jgi:hypothetical protein
MATDFRSKTPPPDSGRAKSQRAGGDPSDGPKVPPLRNGDRLTADEFLRRYEAMPGVKAELIDGRVYLSATPVRSDDGRISIVASPVRAEEHAEPHHDLVGWLAQYRAFTPGVRGGAEGTLRLDLDNNPQPDAYLRIEAARGGQCHINEEGYIAGGPELVAEIAASSVNYDLHEKLNAYRRHGVREYIVWRVEDAAIDWFALREGSYEPLAASHDGIFRSETFPGLWLDAAALLRGDLAAVLDTLRRGLETSEHAAFAEKLRAAANG